MRGGLISRRYKTKAAERLHHSTECPPCVLTSLGLAAFQVHLHRQAWAPTSEQALLAALFMPPRLHLGTQSLSSCNDVSCRPPLTLLRNYLPPFCAFVKCAMQLLFSLEALFSF